MQLVRAGDPSDTEGETARACPRHAVAALNGIAGARVMWEDTHGINDHERTALQQQPPDKTLSGRCDRHPGPMFADGWADQKRELGHEENQQAHLVRTQR
jgi:hypothetical protein